MELSPAKALANSLTPEMAAIISDFAEVGLDAVSADSILKEVPVMSTVVHAYNIGKTVRENYHKKKFFEFIKAMIQGIADEQKRREYAKKFRDDEKFRNQELEYALVMVERFVGMDKPQMLAKVYLSYLDGDIQWVEFTQYAEIIDRFLPGDFEALKSAFYEKDYAYPSGSGPRLQSMGLVTEEPSRVGMNLGRITVQTGGTKHGFTEFGKKLVEILT